MIRNPGSEQTWRLGHAPGLCQNQQSRVWGGKVLSRANTALRQVGIVFAQACVLGGREKPLEHAPHPSSGIISYYPRPEGQGMEQDFHGH